MKANAFIHSILLLFGHIICSLTIETGIDDSLPPNTSFTFSSTSPLFTNPSSPQSTGQSIKLEFIRSPPPTLSVTEGSDAIIPCEAIGLPKPEVFWYKTHFESREQPALLSNNGKYSVLTDGSLKIIQVNASVDSAIYTCTQINPFGFLNGSTSLFVEIQTHIVNPPNDVKVILSSTAEFSCGVRKDPTVQVNVSWSYNGRILENSSRIHILPDGTLRILHARNTDVGWYNCSVKSVTGNDSRRAKLSLIELPHAPGSVTAVLNTENKFINISWNAPFDGNSPILKYIVQSKILTDNSNENLDETGSFRDDLNLGWVTIMENVTSSQTFILIPTISLRSTMSYQFRVFAVNSIGEGQTSSPTSPPLILPAQSSSAPLITGTAKSSTAILIQWQQPELNVDDGQLDGYMVRYKLAGYSDTPWYHVNISHPDQLSYLLDDLIVYQSYEIQVAAHTEKGVRLFSQSIYLRTKEGQPASPPNQIKVEAMNSTTIQVWWRPPDPQLINGVNQGYKLRAYFQDMTIAKELIVPPQSQETQSAFIHDLEPYTTYLITVACFTSGGDGPTNVPPIEVKTEQDFPEVVGYFKFWDLFDTNVKLGWNAPDRINGELVGYDLKYCVIGSTEDQCNVLHYSPETTETSIRGLLPETAYLFAMNARTQIGAGPMKSFTIKTKIPPVLPEPPTDLALSNVGAFTVVLQFIPGFNGNATIVKWVVEAQLYKTQNSNWTVIYESNQTNTDEIIVKNLRPYTDYKLRLIPFNVVGRSVNSSAPSPPFQTLQAPPVSPPLNVTLNSVSSRSLTLRWTPLLPESWHGHPRGYNITWRTIENENGASNVESHFLPDFNSNSFTINDLEEFTNYGIQVFALNDIGSSPGSPLIIQRTSEATPSEPPSNIHINALSSTSIVLRWDDVPQIHRNGLIQGYKVRYISNRSDVVVEYKVIVKNNSHSVTLTELKKYTVYMVSISAFTRTGDGVYSEAKRILTDQDIPGKPSNLTFSDVTLTTVKIEWDIPEEPNGLILAYMVSYKINSNDEVESQDKALSGTSDELGPDIMTYEVTGLKAETSYQFSVTAKTIKGWGEAAIAFVETTDLQDTFFGGNKKNAITSEIDAVFIVIVSLICVLIIVLLVLSLLFVRSVKRARATRGTYSPSTQEMFGNSATEILKPPPEERLI